MYVFLFFATKIVKSPHRQSHISCDRCLGSNLGPNKDFSSIPRIIYFPFPFPSTTNQCFVFPTNVVKFSMKKDWENLVFSCVDLTTSAIFFGKNLPKMFNITEVV
jgi:hypothetical protein